MTRLAILGAIMAGCAWLYIACVIAFAVRFDYRPALFDPITAPNVHQLCAIAWLVVTLVLLNWDE